MRSTARRWKRQIAVLALALASAGCATVDNDGKGRGTLREVLTAVDMKEVSTAQGSPVPTPLVRYVRQDDVEGPRNRVLNAMQAGVAAFDVGAILHARAALQDAYTQIEVIYADNPTAQAARSKFVPEAKKDFKGEPYERAMVGYYLGLLDMISGDLENGRAAFRWGEFQDTMSASETYQADMALLTFLIGWTYQCQGSGTSASEYFDRARTIRGDIPLPKAGDNLLVLAEAGRGPEKHNSGKYGEELRYRRSSDPAAQSVSVIINGNSLVPVLAEDVYFQATTLGGRAVDKILAGKASFKETAETVAETAANVAVVSANVASQIRMQNAISGYNNNNDAANLATGLAAAGALVSLFSSVAAEAAKPAADTRYWNNLPERVFVATHTVGELPKSVEMKFQNSSTSVAVPAALYRTGSCYLAIGREHSSRSSWTPSAPDAWTDLGAIQPVAPTPAGPSTGDGLRTTVPISTF